MQLDLTYNLSPWGSAMSGYEQVSDSRVNIDVRIRTVAMVLALVGTMMIVVSAAHAQAFTTLYNFKGQADGGTPSGVLSMDRAGNIYGTASTGGNETCEPTCGTVFKLSRKGSGWVFSPIYSFHGSDGDTPESGVIIGPDGNLYGTTMAGGALGQGVVYRLQPPPIACQAVLCPWTETVLHSFAGNPDGSGPGFGSLVFDKTGNIYGTTIGGGANYEGTVYELSPSNGGWTETVIYSFQPEPDGNQPEAGVSFDAAGKLYGTTVAGGSGSLGTVFQLTPSGSGWTESVLYRFSYGPDGVEPFAGITVDAGGNLYGATGNGFPAVFELTPSNGGWTFQVLYTLDAIYGPYESLSFDPAGNLLGTVYEGTPEVLRLTPSNGQWTLTGFNGGAGGFPLSNVIQDASGNLYATASAGGNNHKGVVFEITP
jgi:uncharacterized repeat protein (TIGR03803 family)